MATLEPYHDSRSTDDLAGSRTSREQEQALLSNSVLPTTENEKWRIDQGSDDEDDGGETICCINRWWKLALFLLIWTALIPLAVSWIHRDSYADSERVSTDTGKNPFDEYILSSDWDFETQPQVREYTWTIQETEYNPDGVFRTMILINNQYPGPLVEVNEFDTIRVHVINKASNATSIHWHGLYQNGTNHMDGTVGVTQCPIAPSGSFTYEFQVAGQSGTYWYHGHQGIQASDGLVGPLIIHSKNEKTLQKIDYATDRIIMVQDHYHDLSGALTRRYLAPDQENSEPVPDGALINGRNIRDCSRLPHRKCDNTTSNVGTPTFNLAPNQHHRLRIINVGAFAEFQFQIDEHELAITEVDGTDVWPEYYHRLNINPAQRYSVVVNTNASTSDTFWMRARMITYCFAEPNPYMEGDLNAIVRYDETIASVDQALLPTSQDWGEALWVECRDLNTTELVPVEVIAAPAEPDAFYYLRSNFEIGAYRLSRGFWNTSSYRPNVHSPTLSRAVNGLQSLNDSFVNSSMSSMDLSRGDTFVNDAAFDLRNELVIQTSGIQTIDILIRNYDDGNHPIHLHGYKYFVLAQGHGSPERVSRLGSYDWANVAPMYMSLDLSNPLRRDTASVEAYGWILLRFVADNPGAWAFHCHVSWHTEAGLLMQFLTRTEMVQEMKLPESHAALCAAHGLEKGTAPKDEDYYEEALNGQIT